MANFPTSLDDDSSLFAVTDGVSTLQAAHHNNLKDAVKAIESKVGIYNTAAPTSLDYRIGNPTGGHVHNGASGQGAPIVPSFVQRYIVGWDYQGSIPSGASLGAPFSFGRTVQVESVQARLRVPPSGATTAIDINFGPSSIFGASQLYRPIFPAGTTWWGNASPNLVTYPSGVAIVMDADVVGTNNPGQDITFTFIFKE
jgi:hypothetical protein